MKRRRQKKLSHGYSTAGGRELRLKARPPARFSSLPNTKDPTQNQDKQTKTTVPSGNSYFWHIESPSNRLPGNSYFWRTAPRALSFVPIFLTKVFRRSKAKT